ncbi:MAG: tyrosine-type recombinase/integrase [Saccharofermentans sp.]|nr:tyrosine-type recombinase/integrase [Saccharofermentans sp.]
MERERLMYKCAVYFMTDSGCRRGEVCGLTWDDINLATGEVTVRNNAQYFPREGVRILSTKSGKARKIILNPHALDVMRTWEKEQAKWTCSNRLLFH